MNAYRRIDADRLTVAFACEDGGLPAIVYFGPVLAGDEDLAALDQARGRGAHENQPDVPVRASLLPQPGRGYRGTPALALRRGHGAIVPEFSLASFEASGRAARFVLVDRLNALELELFWHIGAGDVVRASATLTNTGDDEVVIDWLASLALPLPGWATALTRFGGRWSGEMRTTTQAIGQDASVATSRGGKPGFSGAHWLTAGEAGAAANHGRLIGFHLAWSGDGTSLVERDEDGEALVQLGCRLEPGEVVLGSGESFSTPEACFAFSAAGRNGLRCAFHRDIRSDVLPERARWAPRKVHINSWDGFGFDFDEAKLMRLADDAAALGVERFVLDDGWFEGRRDDRTSLGDWTVDRMRFPGGLDPLIAHVAAQGMDFGLWVEPEMVSPNSELYRAHPDWCVHLPARERPTQRHQLVLDLTRAEVGKHLFGVLDALLSDHAIAYLKWDHNRDLFPLTGGHAQTLALYGLLDRLRAAHPRVEIETCSSGGGRVDLAMLSRCYRIWSSDNNDAVERLRINAAWNQYLPLELLGSHVGPAINPVTGRAAPIDFRAKVALFGHMGVEADPGAMSDAERATLRSVIALYRDWRDLLHQGACEEIEFADPALSGLLVRGDRAALALVARNDFAAAFNAERVTLPGFASTGRYRVWLPEPWPAKAARYLHDPQGWATGRILSGRALAESGLAIPLAHPDTAWLIAIESV